ncbi:DUF4279 domain-containing protein [Hymenobacter sp. DH14]|uniref:DUF4279 domain-containing protein n=1 Tax=Hymenobacter cyanobacteriorum TaxID=2926463 RepID=A0A9X1VCL3_9BACT|nr:DUF4279 domain-containing protein [Hymenobacter cyanobacteriorum]MCI1186118.1 DUF4279 domain-containing protein [Hymenobacter cyanobacteriorum]
MPDNTAIIAIAAAEATNPTFGTSKAFLEVHSVAIQDGEPKVAGITIPAGPLPTIVYFAVEDEKFFLAVSVSPVSLTVEHAWVEDYHRISFHATSETLDLQQLAALTMLKPTESWNKGDQRKLGGALRKQSSIEFEPHPGPGEFEARLKKLLSFLEQDHAGVQALVDKADGYLRIISVFHNGNTMLGGLHLDKECIQRMAALNLEIDFDLYAEGNFYQS